MGAHPARLQGLRSDAAVTLGKERPRNLASAPHFCIVPATIRSRSWPLNCRIFLPGAGA